MFKYFGILFLLPLIFLSSCGKKANERGLEVSYSAVVSGDFVGGAVVRVENPLTNTFTDTVLGAPPFVVAIPDGTWNIHFIGFLSDGTTQCGTASNVNLTSTTAFIDVTVNAVNCANAPFLMMRAAKIATWDASKWDNAKWAP